MNASWISLQCPYCGEIFEAPIEAEAGESQVIDCAVCCRPIHLRARGHDDYQPQREDD